MISLPLQRLAVLALPFINVTLGELKRICGTCGVAGWAPTDPCLDRIITHICDIFTALTSELGGHTPTLYILNVISGERIVALAHESTVVPRSVERHLICWNNVRGAHRNSSLNFIDTFNLSEL